MNLMHHLCDALLTPARRTPRFVEKACTLLRRSLRVPHLHLHPHQFPPDALTVCVFAHLSQLPLESVHHAYKSFVMSDEDVSETPAAESLGFVKQAWEEGWQPAIPLLQSSRENNLRYDYENPLFAEYFVYLVPSLFFSKRLAALLLAKVKENGGDGTVVANGEKGFKEIAEELHRPAQNNAHRVLCTDLILLKRFYNLCDIPGLPHKWLTDSIREKRVKSIQAYDVNPPPQLITSPVTPAVSEMKRRISENENDTQTIDEEGHRKRMKLDGIFQDSRTTSTKQLKMKLFRSPSKVDEAYTKRNDSGHRLIEQPKKKQKRWACETRTSFAKSEFPVNDKMCELLGVIQESYSIRKDTFRAMGYQKAIAKIRSLDYEILTCDDARRAGAESTIGVKIERKLVEIVKTGRLIQAEAVLENTDNVAVKLFCDIWGVGPVKAMHIIAHGIKSIEQLRVEVRKQPALLDRNQTIGLRLYEDLLHRIPRNEVADLEMYVRKVVKEIDSTLDITVAGSYLRGKSTCGDVDIMIYGTNENLRNAFPKVRVIMKKRGVLTDDLIDGPDKYFGIFKLPGRRHGRVDLFAVPREQYPFALLTYTGSAIFNRSMRAKARALGYSLSHKGLQRVCRTKHTKARLEPSIHVADEKEIFFLLDIPYVTPSARSIS